MRISDWSSDVCSSDLVQPRGAGGAFCAALQGKLAAVVRGITHCMLRVLSPSAARASVFVSSCDGSVDGSASPSAAAVSGLLASSASVARKSVVEGQRVSVRVDLGGRGILKKKKKTK